MADKVRAQPFEGCLRALSTATHLAQTDVPIVCFDLDDGTHKSAPVGAAAVTKRRLEWDGHRGGTNVYDIHNCSLPITRLGLRT